MGYNARNDEIHENVERMRPERESVRGFARYRPAVQRATIREEDRMVLADNQRRVRVKTSLASHRV